MKRIAYLSGAALGFLGVALGAFGAHALREVLEANGRAEIFATATKYHMFHALLLVVLGIVAERGSSIYLKFSVYATLVGTLIFAGSLYLLASLDIPQFGAVTPLGGLGLLAGWMTLFLHFYHQTKNPSDA